MIRYYFACLGTQVASRLVIVAAVASLVAAPASATLMMDSLHYDGRVSNGTTDGIEKHYADFSPDVAPPVGFGGLPADNSQLNGLLDGFNLKAGITEAMTFYNGGFVQESIITINRDTSGTVFRNNFDGDFPYPIWFDGLFYSNSIGPDKFVDIKGIGIEGLPAGGTPPFPSPGPPMYSGKGTQADPRRIQFGIAANQVVIDKGAVKVHLYYTLEQVPEPASTAMALLGFVTVAAFRRRQ